MSDLRSLIESLHLEEIEEDKSKSKSQFNMDGNEPQPKREHKRQRHPHVGPDNRGKWQRTPEYSEKKSLEMRLKWEEPEWKDYMRERQKGVHHKFTHGWSEESKKRYSEKLKNTMFINNGSVNRRHKNDQPIPEGWYKGRLNKENKKI